MPFTDTISIPCSLNLTHEQAAFLQRVCSAKGVSISDASTTMVTFCLRILEESTQAKGTDLNTDLDFGKALRQRSQDRLDQILSLAEKVLLETQGIEKAVRNRVISIPTVKKSNSGETQR